MKKVVGIIIGIIVMLLCCCTQTQAAYQTSSSLNDFLVKVEDFPPVLENGKTYTIQMVFAEKENQLQFQDTGSLTYTLPKQIGGAAIQLSNEGGTLFDIILKDENGQSWTIYGNSMKVNSSNNTVTVTFNEEDPNYEKLTACGDTTFKFKVNMKVNDGGTEKKIIFSDKVQPTFEYNQANINVTKSVEKNGDLLNYTLKITSKTGINSNVTIIDKLANSKFLTYEKGSLKYGTTTSSLTSVTENKVNDDLSGFEYIINHIMHEGEVAYLTYSAKINYDSIGINKAMTADQSANTVTVRSNEGGIDTSTISYTGEVIPWTIDKTASSAPTEPEVNETGDKYINTIDWKLKINSQGKGNTTGAVIEDKLGKTAGSDFSDLYYSGEGITLTNKEGYKKLIKWDNIQITLYDENGNVTTNLLKARSWKYKITEKDLTSIEYSTVIEILNSANSGYTTLVNINKAMLKNEKEEEISSVVKSATVKGPGIKPESTINKNVTNIDETKDEVTWKIESKFNVKENDINKYTGTIIDTLPNYNGKYDTYLSHSYRWEGEIGGAEVQIRYDEVNHRLITTVSNISKLTTGKLIIELKTIFNKENSNWTTHTNRVTLSGVGDTKSASDYAECKYNKSSIEKSVNSKNELNKQIEWKINADFSIVKSDQNKHTATITDTLDSADKYESHRYEWIGEKGSATVTITYDKATHKLICIVEGIDSTTTGRLVIYVTTTSEGEIIDGESHTNRVTLEGIDGIRSSNATAIFNKPQTPNNNTISKSVEKTDNKTDEVTWKISTDFDIKDDETHEAKVIDILPSKTINGKIYYDIYVDSSYEWEGEAGGATVEKVYDELTHQVIFTVKNIAKATTGKLIVKVITKFNREINDWNIHTNTGKVTGIVEDKTVTADVNCPQNTVEIIKSTENVDKETDEVTWRISTNFDVRESDDNSYTANITDTLPKNGTHKDEYIGFTHEWEGESGGATVEGKYDETLHKIIFTVKNITKNTTGKLIIRLKTKFNREDESWLYHYNNVEVQAFDKTDTDNTYAYMEKSNTSINKTVDAIDSDKDEVTWKIDAKFNAKGTANFETKITDTLPQTTINSKVYKDIYLDSSYEWEGESGGAIVEKVFDEATNSVIFTIKNITRATTGRLVIKVVTKFNREISGWTSHRNSVKLERNGASTQYDGATVTCPQSTNTINKNVEKIDSEKNEITWNIESKYEAKGQDKFDATITDILPNYKNNYDEYVNSSYEWIGESGGATVESRFDEVTHQVIFTIKNITKDTIGKLVIKIITRSNRNVEGWTDHVNTVKNAQNTGTTISTARVTYPSTIPTISKQEIEKTIDEKGAPSYTYILKISGIDSDTITIRDILSANKYFKIDESSIEIYGSDSNYVGYNSILSLFKSILARISNGEEISLDVPLREVTASNATKYYKYYYIKYKIVVKGEDALESLKQDTYENTDHTLLIKNTASFKDATSNTVTSTYTYNPITKEIIDNPTIDNNYVGKFVIKVNKERYDMDPNSDTITIVDKMSRMQIKPSSIIVKADGEIIKAIYKIEKDGTIIFTVPDGKYIEITYLTDVQGVGDDVEISNTASVSGLGSGKTVNKTLSVRVVGEGKANNRAIIIHKTDAKTGKDLEGVEFTLYEAIRNPDGTFSLGKAILNKNGEVVRYTTDSQGRIIVYGNSFKDGWVLELGKAYALVETGFLSGYNQNVQPIYFILGEEADGINTYKPYDVIEVQNSKEENTEDKKEELKNVPATGDEITTLIGIASLSILMILAIEKLRRKLVM